MGPNPLYPDPKEVAAKKLIAAQTSAANRKPAALRPDVLNDTSMLEAGPEAAMAMLGARKASEPSATEIAKTNLASSNRGFLDRSSYEAPPDFSKAPVPTPVATSATPVTPLTPAEQIATQTKALKDRNAITSTPVGVEDTPGTTAYYTGGLSGKGPTTTGTVPGKGSGTIQHGTGENDAATMPGARTGQISVGARTDAEAARNLQARAEQSQAAQANIDSMNRAAEALRDTRATKLGVSRGVLDRMEGRDTPAAQAALAAQTAPDTSAPGVFDRPGDGFGDAQMRESRFNSLMEDASNTKSKRKAAAKFQAASALLQPGTSALEADTAQRKVLGDQRTAQINALADWQRAQMQEAGQDRRAKLAQEGNLQTAQVAQLGGLAREEMQQKGLTERDKAKNMGDAFKAGADYITKATMPDGKNPAQVSIDKLTRMRDAMNYGQLAQLTSPETAKRLKSGEVTASEAQRLVSMARDWDEDPKKLTNLWMATAQAPTYTHAPMDQ